MRYADILREEVFGAAAWVYHRTKQVSTIEAIKQGGFRTGDGQFYGRGVYATYELASQFGPYMAQYGDYVVRAKVNLWGFLIFDEDVAQQVYGENHGLHQQVRVAGMKIDPRFRNAFTSYVNDLDEGFYEFSSEVAKHVAEDRMVSGLKGMVYTGARDGRCIVAYDASTVIPFAYANAPVFDEDGLTNPDPDPGHFTWHRIIGKHHLRSRSDTEKLAHDPHAMMRAIDKLSPEQQIAAVRDHQIAPWLIRRPSRELVDYMLEQDRFNEIAMRVTPEDAKRAIFASVANSYSIPETNPVFSDPEVQRFLVAAPAPDDAPDYWHLRLRQMKRVPDDVLLKMLNATNVQNGRLTHLFGHTAPHIRDPEAMRALMRRLPRLLPLLRNPPADLVRDVIDRYPTLVTELTKPPPDVLTKAVATNPMILLNLRPELVTPAVLRAAASEHLGAFAVVQKRRNYDLPPDVAQKLNRRSDDQEDD